jgi:hypothetical protein
MKVIGSMRPTAALLAAVSMGASVLPGQSRPVPVAARVQAVQAAPPCTPAPMAPSAAKSAHWMAGFAKELLDPRPADIAGHQLHLGGYGLFSTRATTGPLVAGEHLYVSAMAVCDPRPGGGTLLLAALENQGTFAADKQGPYGITDMREQVSRDTGVPEEMIVINSDHSHAGPDLIGLWGGVPVAYLQYVHDQAVRALDEAYRARVPARLLVGADTPTMPTPAAGHYIAGTATPGEAFVHSQFGADTVNHYPDDAVDTQLRVLQAVDAAGRPLGTLINYAAHATVMGSGNVGFSADWPGRVARATESALHESVAVTMVADVGRSQPPRPHSDPGCGAAHHPTCDVDLLDTYTRLLTPWVLSAVHGAVPVQGRGVSGAETLVREAAVNGALLGVSYTGEVPVRGYGAYRSATPPFTTGTVVGSYVSVHRVGNLLLTAAPGEAYPDIRNAVNAQIAGTQATFTFGLANDQLGYIIAPTTEYGWITTSQPGNDNAFFNVAPQFGDHVMCTQVALAQRIGFRGSGQAQPYGSNAPAPVCAALTADDALPAGPAPQQPWPFGDGIALPPPFPQ